MQHPEVEEASYTTSKHPQNATWRQVEGRALIRLRESGGARLTLIQRDRSPATGHRRKVSELRAPKNHRQMPKPSSQSLLYIAAAALAARGAGEAAPIVIDDFSGPVDAFFLDDGTAAGLPSSGDSALEKVEDGLRLNYDVARNGPFGAALLGKIWGGYRDLSNASHIRLTYRVERRRINSTASDDGVELPRRARCVGLPRRRGDGVEPPRPRGARRRAARRQGVRPRAPL